MFSNFAFPCKVEYWWEMVARQQPECYYWGFVKGLLWWRLACFFIYLDSGLSVDWEEG